MHIQTISLLPEEERTPLLKLHLKKQQEQQEVQDLQLEAQKLELQLQIKERKRKLTENDDGGAPPSKKAAGTE